MTCLCLNPHQWSRALKKRGEEHLEDLRAVRVHPSVATDVSQMFPWKGVTACGAGSPGPLNMLRRSDLWSLRCPPGGAGSEDVLGVCEEEQQPACPSSPPAAGCELQHNLEDSRLETDNKRHSRSTRRRPCRRVSSRALLTLCLHSETVCICS